MTRPTHDAMALLFQRAQSKLSTDDLSKLSELSDHAATEALRLANVCAGIGCLVLADKEGGNAGNFSNNDSAAELLWSVTHHLEVIAGMASVGSQAAFIMQERLSKQEGTTA